MFASKDLAFSRPSGYQISRSVRLRSSASAYFSRSAYPVASTGTQWTMSMWVKRGKLSSGSVTNNLFSFVGTTGSAQQAGMQFDSNDCLRFWQYAPSTYQFHKITTAVFRDTSAWYHIVFVYDTTLATAADRCQIWVNGVRQTSFSTNIDPSQNLVTYFKTGQYYPYIGSENRDNAPLNLFDGYLTETNFIDGQALTPSSFGQFNANGVWSPIKYAGTYGTNGFYLNFSDNSASTATTIGKDNSGNGNNWTPNNISVTAGVTYDSMLDVPTPYADGGNGRGNYAVMNPLNQAGTATPTNGNLTVSQASDFGQIASTIAMEIGSGKWYYEHTITAVGGENSVGIGASLTSAGAIGNLSTQYGYYFTGGKVNNATNTAYGSSYTTGDVIGVAYDATAGSITFYKNNVSQGVAFTGITGTMFALACTRTSGGQNSSNLNFGQRPFTYTPPTGYVALNTQNLSTPTIANGAAYMAATTYTGTGATQTISNAVNGLSFQPDWVWTKARSAAIAGLVYDSVRGATKYLQTNSSAAEGTGADSLTAFASNGFTVGADTSTTGVNQNTTTYVGWQWKAGGTSSSNTSGSITSTVSAGATQGFSVVTYTGTGANATVGHGLGVAPSMIIAKSRGTAATNWGVWHTSLTAYSYFLLLNSTAAQATAANTLQALPTSTLVSLGSSSAFNDASTMVMYCFSAVAGYSAFGSYTGNGSADGPFVYLGFRPKFVMIKRTDTTGNWLILDTSRNTYNVVNAMLNPNLSDAEATGVAGTNNWDFLSNGFKPRGTGALTNASGGTYIYMAFAENPFKYSLAR